MQRAVNSVLTLISTRLYVNIFSLTELVFEIARDRHNQYPNLDMHLSPDVAQDFSSHVLPEKVDGVRAILYHVCVCTRGVAADTLK